MPHMSHYGAHVLNKNESVPSDSVVVVPSLDLGRYLLSVLNGRLRKAVMKMDIEGAEWRVLPHLDSLGLLCQKTGIHTMTIEFHYNLGDVPMPKMVEMHNHYVNSSRTSQLSGAPLPPGCTPTNIIEFDSEAYLLDTEHPLTEFCAQVGKR